MGFAFERRWIVDVRVSSGGAISIALSWTDAHGSHRHEALCSKPSDALQIVSEVLGGCDEGEPIALVLRSPTVRLTAWTTRSASGALYWCAAMLGKCWPPSFVPMLERRARHGWNDVDAAPLIERRRWPSLSA